MHALPPACLPARQMPWSMLSNAADMLTSKLPNKHCDCQNINVSGHADHNDSRYKTAAHLNSKCPGTISSPWVQICHSTPHACTLATPQSHLDGPLNLQHPRFSCPHAHSPQPHSCHPCSPWHRKSRSPARGTRMPRAPRRATWPLSA